MKAIKLLALLAIVTILAVPTGALANDGATGRTGGLLVPLNNIRGIIVTVGGQSFRYTPMGEASFESVGYNRSVDPQPGFSDVDHRTLITAHLEDLPPIMGETYSVGLVFGTCNQPTAPLAFPHLPGASWTLTTNVVSFSGVPVGHGMVQASIPIWLWTQILAASTEIGLSLTVHDVATSPTQSAANLVACGSLITARQ